MKATFCIFTFIRFLIEKCIKIQARMAAKKSTQHDALKDPNSSQNVWKFDDFGTEKNKSAPKMWFSVVFCFGWFLELHFLAFWTSFGLKMGSRAKTTFKLLRLFWKSKLFFWGHRLFYRFCSQKYRQNAQIRIWLLENPMGFVPNAIEIPMPGSPIFPI